MGVFDKLKNVFFEEEYVEVEEPVKKPKKEKPVIAKKVDLPDMPKVKEVKTEREKEIEKEVVEHVEKKESELKSRKKEQEYKFPMEFDIEDFEVDDYKKSDDNNRIDNNKKYSEINSNNNSNIYSHTREKNEERLYDYQPSGLYEGKEHKQQQKIFRPTPIISPIYGVLDKNYKKDEIVQKKEVRLSTVSSKKVDFDTVREKAYGDLTSDIAESIGNDKINQNESVVDTSLEESLYDLSDNDHPVVNNVTVGDAEEYYNDLGLEYNIDYKDHNKEKATGRRSQKNAELNNEKSEEKQSDKEDSLFDLIDSMYEDSEEE